MIRLLLAVLIGLIAGLWLASARPLRGEYFGDVV